MEEIERWGRNREEEEDAGVEVNSERARSIVSIGSGRGNSSVRNEREISGSSGLSAREVKRIKRWVVGKDRKERKRNIIIKGIRI